MGNCPALITVDMIGKDCFSWRCHYSQFIFYAGSITTSQRCAEDHFEPTFRGHFKYPTDNAAQQRKGPRKRTMRTKPTL
eukprot:scaffold145438_cov20-Prasinocladus_malaysianus.AAC.1